MINDIIIWKQNKDKKYTTNDEKNYAKENLNDKNTIFFLDRF